MIIARLRKNQTGVEHRVIKWDQVKEAFTDYKTYLFFPQREQPAAELEPEPEPKPVAAAPSQSQSQMQSGIGQAQEQVRK